MDNTNNLDKPKKRDLESTNSKDLKYPRSVFFIVGNEFCERFCYYGMKAVLTLYFTKVLIMTEDEATEAYHEFILFAYFTPLIGAVLADSYLGKFNTILYLSILYAAGNIALSASSYFEHTVLSIFSLGLIAFGTGGIKPCVSAFGGDQFVAGQEDQLNKFFAIYYMSINLGSLVSTFITPILRSDVSCSARGDCFPLAFGVPAILMTVALLLFIAGKPFYRIVKVAKGNIIFDFFQCNAYAIGVKLQSLFTSKKGLEKRDHWLDYAEDKFSPKLIQEVKTVNRVLFLFVPLPLFWALFDQQGSRWTLQALKMDGILFGETALKPDQLQVINPILIVGMIPVFQYIIYPITDKLGIVKTPLQRMTVGGLLAGASFILAAFLQMSLESEVPQAPSLGYGAITLINSLPCAITLVSTNKAFPTTFSLDPGSAIRAPEFIPIGLYPITVQSKEACFIGNIEIELKNFNLKIDDKDIKAIHFIPKKSESSVQSYSSDAIIHPHSLVKPDKGDAAVQIAYSLPYSIKSGENSSRSIYLSKSLTQAIGDPSIELNYSNGLTRFISIETFSGIENYNVLFPDINRTDYSIKVRNGAAYILVVSQDPNSGQVNYKLNQVVNENHLNMLWQIPQYLVITCGEIMFSITGLEFSYSQAPTSMKSVLSAAWLLTVSFGNLLVAIITKYIKFNKQSIEFFFFAGLMICDMVVFAFIAYLYTYSYQALDDGNSDSSPGNGTVKSNGQGVNVTSSSHPPSSSSSVESPHTKHDSPVNRMRTQSGSKELQDTKL